MFFVNLVEIIKYSFLSSDAYRQSDIHTDLHNLQKNLSELKYDQKNRYFHKKTQNILYSKTILTFVLILK